ncbi:MAG: GMC family oxidoreductase N-terminal domain-containing protein, partial [Thermoanaerobaculia bacterium]|nr:GMC family oxidoreductase N-terminal domain-containing protein [Thermoanaerobaculia bacterium]
MKPLLLDRPIPNLMRGREIRSNLALSADVCIVGSGPGGAIAGARLAASGARVILLEEGGYFTRKADFHMQEAEAYPKLYQEHGNRATDDLSITILQGRGVGGGTLVNWTTCFRTPEATLAHWRERFGLVDFTAARFAPHWEEVEARLNIREVDASEVNENNAVLLEGAKKLGIATEFLRRNVMSCLHTGYCGMGCPTNAKRGMALTYLPDAAAKGARVYADCRADRLVLDARKERVTAVEAEVLDSESDRPSGRRITVSAARFVVAGGAINSPALLLRSGIPDPHGRIGRRTFLHPVVATLGLFDRRIDPFYGAPQSVASHAFVERPGKVGFFLEVAPLHPMLAGLAHPAFGAEHRDGMKGLARTNAVIALLRDGFLPDEEGGTVSLREGGKRLSITYPLGDVHFEAMREAMRVSARIQLAAGAREVRTLHRDAVVIRDERDLG